MTPQERIAKVKQAVARGAITQTEADAYLRATCATAYEKATDAHEKTVEPILPTLPAPQVQDVPQPAAQPAAPPPIVKATEPDQKARHGVILAALLVAPVLVIIALSLIYTGGPTGLLILDIPHGNLTNGSIAINESVTSVRATGTLYGEGTASIYLDTEAGEHLLVASLASDSGAPRTAKASYAAGEEVTLEHAPSDATYYFDDGESSAPIDVPLNATANGTLLIIANESGQLTTYRLPIIVGDAPRETPFADTCIETCSINATNGTLRIETTGGAQIALTQVDVAAIAPNRPPQLAIAIPTQEVNATTSLDLDPYFVDPDGDSLHYTAGSSDLVSATVEGSRLILTPAATGNGTLTIYASDLHDLVPASIDLLVTATAGNSTGIQNATENATAEQNITLNKTNTTTNETTDITVTPDLNTTLNESNSTVASNTTANVSALDCSSTNPNLRPTECLLLDEVAYFPDQDIFWEDLDRAQVAKFTIIGNLLIKGTVVERSTGVPGSRDFRIGYPDQDGNIIPTIWIDGASGDLHLRGSLHEETLNIQPPAGSYSVLTKRSIYLAYAHQDTGDLFIRGNIIPYRRSIE